MTLYYRFVRCYQRKLGKGYIISVCIIYYYCMWIYSYLKIKKINSKKLRSLKKKKHTVAWIPQHMHSSRFGCSWFWGTVCFKGSYEKAMAPHSSTLAWKIPWTEEPGGLQSMGSLTVGHDWATSLSLFTFMHWRRKWQPTPVFLPGESQGRESLVGCRLWGCTEPDTTEVT